MDAAPAEPSARAGHCCQPHSELQGDGKRAQGTEMSSFPPLLSASGMKLPREGVLPTTCCFLPPTRVCFWPSSTSPCRKSRLWFPWKRHLRGGPPQSMQHSRAGAAAVVPRVLLLHPTCPATPSPAWQPPPGFHQSLSDHFSWQPPRQPWCQATQSGGRTSAARETCRANLSSLGRTEHKNCTCVQSEPSAQLCTL